NNIIICHDIAYSELAFENYKPCSILQLAEARSCCVEFHSLSKSFNMAGCRIGFVVGNAEIISNLAKIKSNIDFGIFKPLLEAGIAALTGPQEEVCNNAAKYERRRNILVDGLNELGWRVQKPKASMFVWAKLPEGYSDSFAFTEKLLQEAGVLVVPGVAFGRNGEGYVRFALVQEEERLKEAVRRIKATNIIKQG
ncbi:MAG: aminotransferase class I/II-fold pyridoxal phosphate-dependent enzyme, partial [Bacillota bacterium]|nr:aminotransferase class I/II-fold pyridoxal phosphate-dependent enzyme [Bacillota bacterium]